MKKLSFILVIFALFIFVGCDDANTKIDIPDTDTNDTDNPDSDNPDSDNPDSDNPDSDNPDSDNPDSDNPDSDNPDSDNPDSDNPDSDNPDSDNPDSDNPDSDNPDTDPTNPTDPTDPDDPVDPEGCTRISLNPNFFAYTKGFYLGQVKNSVLGDASLYDLVIIELRENIENTEYNLENGNYATCKECLTITQDYESEEPKYYFQESGTIKISNYNSSNYGLKAVISAKLVEVTIDENGNSAPVEGGSCVRIVSQTANAMDNSGKTETCANIMKCMDSCSESNPDCPGYCYIQSTAVARTEYEDFFQCGYQENCGEDLHCYWEHCQEETKSCGINPDSNYKMPYGEVEINGTFNYLHAKDSTEISSDQMLNGPFVTGTFGNNDKHLVDSTATIYSYAAIGNFEEDDSDNLVLIQVTTKNGNKQNPVVEFVTTAKAPGEFTLGLGDWETGARIFVSDYDSNGNRSCYHAFGIGNITISAISSDWAVGATTITVSGNAELYSPKANLDYDMDDLALKFPACDPVN